MQNRESDEPLIGAGRDEAAPGKERRTPVDQRGGGATAATAATAAAITAATAAAAAVGLSVGLSVFEGPVDCVLYDSEVIVHESISLVDVHCGSRG